MTTERFLSSRLYKKSNKLREILVIVAAAVILTAPVLLFGFPFIADDATFHSLWATEFSRQFWQGDLYPRWLLQMNAGLGSPAFFYYPPVPYYFTALCRVFVGDDPYSWRSLGLSAILALVLSGLSAYRWTKRIAGDRGWIVAVLYLLLPYHLAVDLYKRGAFAEFWAFVWMPLVLSFVIDAAHKRRFAVVGLAIAYALLIMTHLPTTLLFSIVPPVYGALLAYRQRDFTVVLRVVAAMLLGIALAAVYLFPALALQQYISISELTTGFYSYRNWFLFSNSVPNGDATLAFPAMVAVVALITASAVAVAQRTPEMRTESWLWAIIAGISLAMMFPFSAPVWEVVRVIQVVQFPWRFNTVLSIAATALVALALASYSERKTLFARANLAFIGIMFLFCLLATAYSVRIMLPGYQPKPEQVARQHARLASKLETYEYWPIWTPAEKRNFLVEKSLTEEKQTEIAGQDASDSVSIEEWRARSIVLKVDSVRAATLTVNQLYYPGWRARILEREQEVAVEPTPEVGLVGVQVPAGRYTVELRLEQNLPEKNGQYTSLAALFAILLLTARDVFAKRPLPPLPTNV